MKINGVPTDYTASSGGKITTHTASITTTHMMSDPSTGYFEATVYCIDDGGWFFHSQTYAQTIGDILTIERFCIYEKDFVLPYAPGNTLQASLHLPYDIIDCKTDFTIYGWWYPKVYADGSYRPCLTRNIPDSNTTYNRILIMGNGTTSRQLRCWHGSDGLVESSVYVPTTTLVRDNEWNFFSLRRSGTSIILSLGNSSGISHGTTATAVRLDADETGQFW